MRVIDAEHEAATLENLRREGFPLRDDVDVLLLRGERPEWASDKQGRRDLVASGFRGETTDRTDRTPKEAAAGAEPGDLARRNTNAPARPGGRAPG